ncbi:tetratricopeptide repeat-containing sensor histidine kinase [Cellulophaga baltica]|uniref:tetratricopeptide repeat-containing sensor histidine kinase n=1 Tax=Cellulophaga baltica TaxID=76594 RepID=UPI0024958841|nr:ATP-binding protein [Cellulophaga baltica]
MRTGKITYLYISICTLAALLLFTCAENDNSSQESSSPKVVQDSLSILVNRSSDPNLNIEERKQIVQEALDKVNLLPTDSIKLKHLAILSFNSVQLKDSVFFRTINKETISLAQKEKDSVAMAEAYWDLGIFLDNTKLIDSTYYYYNEALTIYSKQNNQKKMAFLYNSISTIQRKLGDYAGAEQTTVKALEIFKESKNYFGMSNSYNSLGSITHSLGDIEKAIQYYKIASSYLDSLPTDKSYNQIFITNNIGVSNMLLNQYREAENSFEKVVNFKNLRTINPEFLAKAMVNLANAKKKLFSTEDLEPQYLAAIEITKEYDNTFSEATSTGHYAQYLAYIKDTVKAVQVAKKALVLSEKAENFESLLRTLNFLTLVDKKNASTYAQEYFVVDKKLKEDERKLRDKFARIRFQTDEFIERNELLAKQNELLIREKRLWSALAVLGLIGIAAILIIVIQRIKNNNLRFKQQQQESNLEIFNLLLLQQSKFDEGKKIEQERISQELHDGFLNKILGIRLVLLGLNKRQDEKSIAQRAEVITELAELSEEIRSISHELNEAAFQKMQNFIEAIKSLIKTFQTASETLKYSYKFNTDLDWDSLNSTLKINLYRIVQESIQNCIKHAEASTIFVNFDVEDNFLTVIIEDNGKGFDSKKSKKGIGFRNISSRLEKVNGTLRVDSTIGNGTKLIIRVPYLNEIDKIA